MAPEVFFQNLRRLFPSSFAILALIGPAPLLRAQPVAQASQPADAIPVPLVLEGSYVGDVNLVPSDPFKVETAPVVKSLEKRMPTERLETLARSSEPNGFVSEQALAAAGLSAKFDREKLELHLEIPPEIRLPTDIQLFRREPVMDAQRLEKVANFSVQLNLRGAVDYATMPRFSQDEGIQSPNFDIDGAINAYGLVLESGLNYQGGREDIFTRTETRLVYDDLDHIVRYSAGDLFYPVSGLQNVFPMSGFSITRNYSLQPYRLIEPAGRTGLFLRSRARVEVLVNGRPVQTLELAPGRHNLRNFLFSNGANNVTLRITEETGRVEVVQLTFFFDSRLLAEGEQEFTYNVGVPRRFEDDSFKYGDRAVFSAFHRVGITDTLTAGLNLQGDEYVQMFGAHGLWAMPVGNIGTDIGLSHSDPRGFGQAVRLEYRYYEADVLKPWGIGASLSAQWQSPHFTVLSDPLTFSDTEADFAARVYQRLPWQLVAGAGGSYQLNRNERDTHSIELFFGKRWGRNISTDVTLERQSRIFGETEYRGFFSFSWLFPGRHQSINGSYDTFSRVGRADWQYTPPTFGRALHSAAGLQQGENDTAAYGHLRYYGYRGEAALEQNLLDSNFPGGDGSVTTLRAGTAVVFADGHLGISRPIQDSFALLYPSETLKGERIGIETLDNQPFVQIDRFGPAVLPDLTSYQIKRINVESPDLPVGLDVGEPLRYVVPRYRSGTVIKIGTETASVIEGVVINADGTPFALQGGEAVPAGRTEAEPVTIMTNREGKFQVMGLEPGEYQLRFFSAPESPQRFVVPKAGKGAVSVGTLRLPEAKKK